MSTTLPREAHPFRVLIPTQCCACGFTRGWTQKQIAERTGLIQELVSNYETDKLRLNPAMILRFAEVFDMSADELDLEIHRSLKWNAVIVVWLLIR
jgi:transcriptional regulator with XRE-family HTH domain